MTVAATAPNPTAQRMQRNVLLAMSSPAKRYCLGTEWDHVGSQICQSCLPQRPAPPTELAAVAIPLRLLRPDKKPAQAFRNDVFLVAFHESLLQ